MQRLQNSGYEYRSIAFFNYLYLPNLETRRNQLSILMFKVSKGLMPNYLTNLFMRTDQVHDHETRHAMFSYHLPKPNTNSMIEKNHSGIEVQWFGKIELVRFKTLLKLVNLRLYKGP